MFSRERPERSLGGPGEGGSAPLSRLRAEGEPPGKGEPAAKVGAVDGALKPPSEDAMVSVGKGVLGNPPDHQPGYG